MIGYTLTRLQHSSRYRPSSARTRPSHRRRRSPDCLHRYDHHSRHLGYYTPRVLDRPLAQNTQHRPPLRRRAFHSRDRDQRLRCTPHRHRPLRRRSHHSRHRCRYTLPQSGSLLAHKRAHPWHRSRCPAHTDPGARSRSSLHPRGYPRQRFRRSRHRAHYSSRRPCLAHRLRRCKRRFRRRPGYSDLRRTSDRCRDRHYTLLQALNFRRLCHRNHRRYRYRPPRRAGLALRCKLLHRQHCKQTRLRRRMRRPPIGMQP